MFLAVRTPRKTAERKIGGRKERQERLRSPLTVLAMGVSVASRIRSGLQRGNGGLSVSDSASLSSYRLGYGPQNHTDI